MTGRLVHIAGFRADDPDELLDASLSCQVCLRRPVLVAVVEVGRDAKAFCYCSRCVTPTEVFLTGEQAHRLVNAPPPGPDVEVIASR